MLKSLWGDNTYKRVIYNRKKSYEGHVTSTAKHERKRNSYRFRCGGKDREVKAELEHLGFLVCRIFKARLTNQFILLSSEESFYNLKWEVDIEKKICAHMCVMHTCTIYMFVYMCIYYIYICYIYGICYSNI